MPTCRLSWKVEAWYWAYLAMVVCERLLSQGHVWVAPLGSQFSSAGCWTWVLTSTAWSELASTRDLVENRPRSGIGKETEKDNYQIITQTKLLFSCSIAETGVAVSTLLIVKCTLKYANAFKAAIIEEWLPSHHIAVENTCFAFKCERWSRKCYVAVKIKMGYIARYSIIKISTTSMTNQFHSMLHFYLNNLCLILSFLLLVWWFEQNNKLKAFFNSNGTLNLLRRREPARPLMTVTAFLGSVQNWSRTGEKASLLLSNCENSTG